MNHTPDPPPLATQAWSLAKAVTSFAADKFTTADEELYKHRLTLCDTCDNRRENRCLSCGCYIQAKARIRSQSCPIGLW